jgi:hypothetical protein
MFYDESDGARKFREVTANGLEFWHSFKMAYNMVHREFADSIFAPLFHSACPANIFFKKTKRLIQTQEACLRLQLAYWKPDIQKLMEELMSMPEPDTEAKKKAFKAQRQIAINFRDLMEWFIPVVNFSNLFKLFSNIIEPNLDTSSNIHRNVFVVTFTDSRLRYLSQDQ